MLHNTPKRNTHLIDVGTKIFLFNRQTDTVFGPFTARSKMLDNIVPSAWGGGSKYPAQVRIDRKEWEENGCLQVVLSRETDVYVMCRKTAGGNWIGKEEYLNVVRLLTSAHL